MVRHIKCPECGVEYCTAEISEQAIKCMDCGAVYVQAIHDVRNDDFVRAASYRTRGK